MDRTLIRPRLLCLFSLFVAFATGNMGLAQEATKDSSDDTAILFAEVVDDDTGESIAEFVALPGVGLLRDLGYRWQWQPHQIYKFTNGQLRWPPPGRRAYSQDQALRIEAEGYLPYITPTIRQPGSQDSRTRRGTREQAPERVPPLIIDSNEPATLTVRLKRDPGVGGRVVDADGRPLSGATIAIAMGNFRSPRIRDGQLYLWPKPQPHDSLRNRWERPRYTITNANGRFSLPSEIQQAWIVVAHPYGFASTSYEDVVENDEIRLRAWGRIEGQAVWNGQPAAGERIRLFAKRHLNETITDSEGRFTFDKVPPGEVGLGRDSVPPGDWNGIPTNPKGRVDVPPGQTVECVLGGRGRPIVGKVVGIDNWQNVQVSVHLDLHWPSNSFRIDDDRTLPALYAYISSSYYRHYDIPQFDIEADGSFRLENVPAERYAIVVTERDGETIIRQGEERFQIKLMPTGESSEAMDVGTIEISENARISSKKIEPR